MKLAQGASTITQQVVKNMVLSSERSITRKVKEAILARRLEQNLSKDEILFLYLNHIYFGHGRYGVEEASRFYFDKPVGKLTLGEAALLAGLPQSPARLSPVRHPDRAKARQIYVLNQMVENGMITRAAANAEIARPLHVVGKELDAPGPYYTEEIRRTLVERYGEELIYEGGLRIDIGMDAEIQRAADKAIRQGLEEVEHRAGFRAPELSVSREILTALRATAVSAKPEEPEGQADEDEKGGGDEGGGPKAWDFSAATAEGVGKAATLAKQVKIVPLAVGIEVVAPVLSVSDGEAVLDLGSVEGSIPFERMKWARPYAPAKWTAAPKKASDVLSRGALVRVRVLEMPRAAATPAKASKAKAKPQLATRASLELAPIPEVQGALVVIDPETRQVVALSGGYDFSASSFNRATQAHRQPGSAFKPFVYAAALASGKFTTASILNDAPDVFRDPWTGKEWKPQNFEKDEFDGPMMLREALAKSKNTISVRLIEAIGPEAVIDLARRAGISSQLPENLTLALGTGEVSPLELANAYTTLAAMGKRADPILVSRVTDATGKVLEEQHAVPEETIPPAIAYITTSLMRSVVETGTGMRASELNRPIAGKTGTASGNRDAWFSGFSPALVATAWVGYDDHSPLGHSETGGRAALPIWLDLMKAALQDQPLTDFVVPAGVEEVLIDPETGLRAAEGAPGRTEVFVEGTAPEDYAQPPGQVDPRELFLEDGADQ
jgi:penicillin-binding protein 1A